MKKRLPRLRKSTFYKILTAIVILVFVPLFSTVLFAYRKVSDISQSEFETYSMETVRQIEHNLSSNIDTLVTMSYSIATNNSVQNYLRLPKEGHEIEKIEYISEIRQFEYSLRYSNLETMSIIISGHNSEICNSNGYFSSLRYEYDFNDNPCTQAIENGNGYFHIMPTAQYPFSRDNGKTLGVVRKIQDNTNSSNTLGYVYINLDYEYFNTIISNVVSGHENDILLLDGDTVIYSGDEANVPSRADASLLKAVGLSEHSSFISIGPIQYFCTYADVSSAGWKLVSLHSMDDYFNKSRSILGFIVVVSISSFLISVLLAVFISRLLAKPVMDLTALMERVKNDDFTVRYESGRLDEIGVMGNVFNSMVSRINTLIESVYKAEITERDMHIMALQSQINPHFLYNTLQSISSIADRENVPDISAMCRSLSSMFRYNVEGGRRFVMLVDEINHIGNYFYLLSIQYKNRLKYEINIPDALLTLQVPRFIIQPLVENAVTHGLESLPEGGLVRISAESGKDRAFIHIQDNGCGISPGRLEEIRRMLESDIRHNPKDFFALDNVNKRLVLNYGKDYLIRVDSEEGRGTWVTLTVPLLFIV